MKNNFKITIKLSLIIFLVMGCAVVNKLSSNTSQPAQQTQPGTLSTQTITSLLSTDRSHPTQTHTNLPSSEGPTLLLQTDFASYQIIDFDLDIIYPFNLPGENISVDLDANLSPSGQQMIYPLNNETVLILDLSTGAIQATYDLCSEPTTFKPDQAVEEVLITLPEIPFSQKRLLEVVKDALTQSLLHIQWFRSDRYRLIVLDGGETSTHLYLEDAETGTRQKLEDQPGLVHDVWVAPGDEKILLKKGYVFEPTIWQDDRYYVIDIATHQVQSMPLPKDVANPAVSWFSPTLIGVIHQTAPVGGVTFSVTDIVTMESHVIIPGSYAGVFPLGEHLLTLHFDTEDPTTSISQRQADGKIFQTCTFEGHCSVLARAGTSHLLLNCETASFLIDGALQETTFGDPVFLFVPSPDGSLTVRVDRNGESTLLDADWQEKQPLTLTGSPLEIIWLPNATGFLYRTPGRLYLYDLAAAKSQLLLESDIFNDYANINGAWINIRD